MDSRKVLLLVGALLIAGITALFARTITSGSSAPQAQAQAAAAAAAAVPQAEVLVATRTLPVGTIIDPTALKFQPWPSDMLAGAYYVRGQADIAKLQGTVLRYAITAGQPLTQGAVVRPGDRGFLAAALTPGMRAVTVPVSAQTAVAGFVFPGDRIDMVLTQDVAGGGDGPPLKVSETILRNIRVLATDQRTDHQAAGDGKTPVQTFTTVTVEATPKMAEQLAVAQTVGTLSLSLRALAERPADLNGGGDAAGMAQPMVDHASYVTGADVSRYQRRTVPGRQNGSAADHGTIAMPGGSSTTGANAMTSGFTTTARAMQGMPENAGVRVARGGAVSAPAAPLAALPNAMPLGGGN